MVLMKSSIVVCWYNENISDDKQETCQSELDIHGYLTLYELFQGVFQLQK